MSNMENQGMKVIYILSTILAIFSGLDPLKRWRRTHFLDAYSPILVSDSDLLKEWRVTHSLDGVQPFLSVVQSLICSKDWRMTHSLNGCLAILISDSDPLKDWRATHSLDGQIFSSLVWSAQRLCSKQLTNWKGVQPFLLVVLICL